MCEKNLEYFCAIFGAMEIEKMEFIQKYPKRIYLKPRTKF